MLDRKRGGPVTERGDAHKGLLPQSLNEGGKGKEFEETAAGAVASNDTVWSENQ